MLDSATSALNSIFKLIRIKRNIEAVTETRSMADLAKLTRVEPLTILSKDCVNLDYISDLLSVMLNTFSAYYLQSVNALGVVNNVEVMRTLDKLNPNRNDISLVLQASKLNDFGLEHSLPTALVPSLESKENMQALTEASNLAVGKLLEVEFCAGVAPVTNEKGETIGSKPMYMTVPISVRLSTSIIPQASIVNILTVHSDDISLSERFHSWRSGRISFIRDLILCQDLIDESKKANMGDDTNTLNEIYTRVTNAKKYGILSSNPSLASASNIFIISEEVAKETENKLGGKLSNFSTREKAFFNTYAMLICVVDREYERVTIYTRGVSSYTSVSVKEVKAAAKGKGPDIADMLKMLQVGSAPSF